MADQEREIEMLTPTTRSGRASGGGADQKSIQQGRVGSSAIEPSAVEPGAAESHDLIAKKRRWLPLAAAATLGLVAALSMSGGPETVSSPDSDTPEETDDEVGVIDPVELDSPLVDGVDVGPESLELVAPIGEFIGMRDPVLSRYGQAGPAEYSVILRSLTSDLRLVDLGTGVESELPGKRILILATDDYLVTYGPPGDSGSTWLTDLSESSTGESIELGHHMWALPAESPDQFWLVDDRVERQQLQLRRLPEGEIVQTFDTDMIGDWLFSGGIPIGEARSGGIFELSPESDRGLRRVADAQLVDADPGRALVRTCDIRIALCDYQWLSRANWAPLNIPVPGPDHPSESQWAWRIAGGGRWLLSDEQNGGTLTPLRLIQLTTGQELILDLGPDFTSFESAVVSSDGSWLATNSATELIVVNLATGDQHRSTIEQGSHVAGMIRTSPELALEPTGTGTDFMGISWFERDGEQPVEATGQSILVTGWLGTGAVLDLVTGRSRPLDGLAEAEVVTRTETDTIAIGLGPSNDLVSLSLEDGSRSSRFLGAVENLAILPGPEPTQVWLGSSGPGIMNLTSGLALLQTPSLAVEERHDFRILTWHLGGTDPLGTSLGSIWRYAHDNGQLGKARNGILVTASNEIALVWECADDWVANGEPPLDDSHPRDEDDCAFVWRSTNDWSELDLALPPNPSGVAGIYGGSRWLLTYASPNESQLVELETGRSISFGANWTDFLDVSPDGRWAIHRTRPDHLVLSDLDSAAYDSDGQADHADLVIYESEANRKIASVTFLPTAE